MGCGLKTVLIAIWTVVGLVLVTYLISFPIFMKKKIAVITSLLERIANSLEQKGKS